MNTNDLLKSVINNEEKWITYDEAASLVNLSKRTLEKLVAERLISAIKIGRSVRFDPGLLKAELLERYAVSKSGNGNWDRL